jgi:UDP-glucose 4-epimerase
MKMKKNKKRVLVTGGAGFIGSTLAHRLVQEGHEVTVVDDLSYGLREYVPASAKFHLMDIRDPKLIDIFRSAKPEVVFHLAAQIDVRKSIEHPIHDAEINIHGSLRVLEASVKTGVKKFVFSSSGGGINHCPAKIPTPDDLPCKPLSPYGVAKLAFELYLHSAHEIYGLEYVALRYANVYGPRQAPKGEAGVIGIFIRKLLKKEALTITGDGKQTRDFIYVDDIVEANMRAMESDAIGVFNTGTGRETNINEIDRLIRKAIGISGKSSHGPAVLKDERRSALESSSAKKTLKWQAKVPIEEGIERTVEWFRKNA